jgi:hypothetical protein
MQRNLGAIAAFLAISLALPLKAAGIDTHTFESCRLQGACRLLSKAELDTLRGGFTVMGPWGPINMSFGISQVVYVNNQLVAMTQLVLPDIVQAFNSGGFTAAQIKAMNDSLNSGAIAAGAASARAAASTTAAIASNSQDQPTGTNQPAGGAASTPSAKSLAGSLSATSVIPTVRVNAVPVTPGSVVSLSAGGALVVQNGPGNISVIPTAQDLQATTNALVIQNTLNNQTISATTMLNVSLSLTRAINAANIQQTVRQALANSLR